MALTNNKRTSLLIVGLGRNADATKFQIDQVERVLAQAEKDLTNAGFDSVHITLDPKDVAKSITQLEEAMVTRDWDLLEVGFAVRGPVESTELFEEVVNAWVKAMPGKGLVFPEGPHDIVHAAVRTRTA